MTTQLSATGAGGGTRLSPPPPPPTVYLSDTFTDANGTLLTAHTMDIGPGWTALSGIYTILANSATTATGTANASVASDSGHSDFTASVDVTPITLVAAHSFPSLAFRVVDASNYLLVQPAIDTQSIVVLSFIAGAFAVLASYPAVLVSGVAHTLKVVASGTSITTYMDGVLLGSVTSSAFQSATLCGLRDGLDTGSALAGTKWDNFAVTS